MNLDLLTTEASSKPEKEWESNGRFWEDYIFKAFFNKEEVGYLRISRVLNQVGKSSDFYFLDFSRKKPIPKPYISFQRVYERFRGNGICGNLIILANEFYHEKLGSNLYSDTLFCDGGKISKKPWLKLEKQRLVVYEPYFYEENNKHDRWRVL